MSLNLIDFFDKGVAIESDRPCLVSAGETHTYGEVQRSSYRIANALVRAGVPPQSRVAVLSYNAVRPFECVLGGLRAGCTWIPVNARADVDCFVACFCDDGVLIRDAFEQPNRWEGAAQLRAFAPTLSWR